MSVEVILGRAGTGKTFACLSQMQKILAAEPFRTEIILLVPAYQTYRAELELAQAAGGSLNTWICSFQRFARQILSEVGGSTVPRISDVGRRLLLRKILIDRAEDLSYYRRAARQRGFAETLAAEIQELRSYSVDAEKILAAASNINDDELNAKIRDLATLYADFRAAIADKQNDDSDLLERAAELIKDSAAVRSAEIFVDGFIFFDPQQRKILRELFTHAKNVHITLPMDADLHSRENIRDVGIFNRAYKTLLAIRELAGEIKITRCENFSRFENDALAFIEQNFFKRVPEIFSGDTDGVKVVEAVNKRVEVEAVARVSRVERLICAARLQSAERSYRHKLTAGNQNRNHVAAADIFAENVGGNVVAQRVNFAVGKFFVVEDDGGVVRKLRRRRCEKTDDGLSFVVVDFGGVEGVESFKLVGVQRFDFADESFGHLPQELCGGLSL